MRLEVPARLRLGKHATDHALRHRQEREGEPGLSVAWMQQKLGLPAFGPEHAIAGDHSVADEESVEVLAYRSGKRVELLGPPRRALRMAKDFGVAAKLLVEQNDRPGARHPVVFRRIDRLKRIVPVAVAITNEVRAGDEARAHRLYQLVDVAGHRVSARSLLEIVLAAPRNGLIEESKVAGGLDIVAERLERPDDDVAMRLLALQSE